MFFLVDAMNISFSFVEGKQKEQKRPKQTQAAKC